jgi:trimeric autotransporter adhesin
MGTLRIGWLSRGLPAMAVMAVLAGGGAAVAAPRPDGPAAGTISTVAGTGAAGFSGDGGPAIRAELNQPLGVVTDGAGNIVLTDGFNNRVRVIAEDTGRFYGRAMTARDIYTIAGTGTAGFSGDGGPGTHAELNQPNWVTVHGANLLITDRLNNRIRKVTG